MTARERVMAALAPIERYHPDFCDCGKFSASDPCDALVDVVDRIMPMLAEAWREGRKAGVDDMIAADLGVNRRNLPNPYETGGRHVDQ